MIQGTAIDNLATMAIDDPRKISSHLLNFSLIANACLLVLCASSSGVGIFKGTASTHDASYTLTRLGPLAKADSGCITGNLGKRAYPRVLGRIVPMAPSLDDAHEDAALNCTINQCAAPGVRCIATHSGKGGLGQQTDAAVRAIVAREGCHEVLADLCHFTGLTTDEVMTRLRRERQFHFTGEHSWWSPSSRTELAWFYRGSQSYLFANAIHCESVSAFGLNAADGPVLDYSGGVGNNVLQLAIDGVHAVYFGIGQAEAEFARFRVASRGLDAQVEFVAPYVRDGTDGDRLHFEPIFSVPDRQYGVVLAFDVLEHIPDYHVTLEHLVSMLRPGGRLVENSPFDAGAPGMAVHVRASRPFAAEMQRLGMTRLPPIPGYTAGNVWVKKG